MSVFREVTIEFGGEEYRFTPSNKLMRRIDGELFPQTLFGVLNQMDGQQAPLPALALIISMMLNEGGGEFTEDDILKELYDDILNNNGNGVRPLVESIAACITMPDAPEGNGGSPAKSKAGGKKRKEEAKTS